MSWIDQVGGEVSESYSFAGLADQGRGLFSDALSGWLQYETIQAQRDASAAQQEQTRSQPTTTDAQPRQYAGAGVMPSGMNATTLVVGGVLLAAVVLVMK